MTSAPTGTYIISRLCTLMTIFIMNLLNGWQSLVNETDSPLLPPPLFQRKNIDKLRILWIIHVTGSLVTCTVGTRTGAAISDCQPSVQELVSPSRMVTHVLAKIYVAYFLKLTVFSPPLSLSSFFSLSLLSPSHTYINKRSKQSTMTARNYQRKTSLAT